MAAENNMISDVLVRRSQRSRYQNQISWSRQGHIAYSSPHNGSSRNNLLLTYLECVDGKTWQLAPSSGLEISTFDKVAGTKKNLLDHEFEDENGLPSPPKITNVLFSNTGWDVITADVYGHVSICVTGIKKTSQTPQPLNHQSPPPSINHASQSPNAQQQQQQQQLHHSSFPMAQYARTSFNSSELLYSDNTTLPLPDLSTLTKRTGNQLIAMKWLNIDKPVIANSPALRVQSTPENPVLNGAASKLGAAARDASGYYYTYNAHQYKSYGAMHPLSTKQACIGIRRNGEVCLWHQEDHGIEYRRITERLPLDGGELIDDASIGFTRDGSVIFVVHCAGSGYIKFFKVEINWGYLLEAAKHLLKNPTYRVPDHERTPPKLALKKMIRISIDDIDPSVAVLTSIDLLSPNFHQSTEFDLLLTFENERNSSADSASSTIYRYQLEEEDELETVHSAFKSIASKRGADVDSVSSEKTLKLSYKQKIKFNESVLSIEPLNLEMLVGIVFANGEIKLFNRADLKPTENIYNGEGSNEDSVKAGNKGDSDSVLLPSSIFSLFDSGFEFPRMEFQPRYTCISPNLCCYVSLPFKSTCLYARSAETKIDTVNEPTNRKGLLLATVAAVALRHTSACYFGFSTDDLVATIRCELERAKEKRGEEYSYRLLISILQECQRAINLSIDISTDQTDKMLQNQPLQRILTLQLSLGTEVNWRRNKSGRIAWALVNLKFVTSSIMYTIHTIFSNMQRFAKKNLNVPDTLANARAREESLISVLGIIRWCVDYIVGLNQELLALSSAFKKGNQQEIEKLLSQSVAIPLILGKVPRAFLLFAISNVRRLFSFVQKFIEKNDPLLTSAISPDNQMGAFKVIEKQLLSDSPWTMGNNSSKLQTPGPANTNNPMKSIVVHPTIEAYYRLGSLLNNAPVSLFNFEKFLVEADAPLRNMRSDQSTSLAIEQQIVCQGHISRTFIEPLKKLCEVYEKSVITAGNVNVLELYFYDVDWLQLDPLDEELLNDEEESVSTGVLEEAIESSIPQEKTDVSGLKLPSSKGLLGVTNYNASRVYNKKLIQLHMHEGLVIDTLRKQLVKPAEFIVSTSSVDGSSRAVVIPGLTAPHTANTELHANGTNGVGGTGSGYRLVMRKCIRCGAISSINENEVLYSTPTFISNPVYQHYQRICFCGGAWANL